MFKKQLDNVSIRVTTALFKPTLRLDKVSTRRSTAITETIVLTGLGILCGYWFTPDLPYFSLAGFSWLTIGPFLIGLRYGFAYAFNSALFLLALMWMGSHYYPPWHGISFTSNAISILFFAVVSGEFCNNWLREKRKLKAAASYAEERLGQVSKAFNLLRISHDKLEQQIASRRILRDSILSVRRHIMKAKINESDIADLSHIILRVFADYVSVQQAGLFDLKPLEKSNRFTIKVLSFFGGTFNAINNDQLLIRALSSKKTQSLKIDLVAKEQYNDVLLLVIPLVDVFGSYIGLILVKKMPFRAFRADNIKLASILAGHIADIISVRSLSSPRKDIDLQNFTVQLMRCLDDIKNYGVDGCVIALQITNQEQMHSMSALITAGQRGLDYSWGTQNQQGDLIIFLLLPLTNLEGVAGYKMRLNKLITENYTFNDIDQAGIIVHARDLSKGVADIDSLMIDYFSSLAIDLSIWQENM